MKKILIIFAVLALIGGTVAITLIFSREKPVEKKEKSSVETEKKNVEEEKTMKTVKLQEEVELRKNETVKLEGKEVYLTIEEFTYSPPPEGAQAFWSGLGVTYKLKISGVEYTSDIQGFFNEYTDIKYKVITVDSDYKTYARVKIEENSNIEKDE